MSNSQPTTKAAEAAPPKPIRDTSAYTVTDARVEYGPDGSMICDGMLMWMSDDAELRGLIRGERRAMADRQWARALPGETAKGIPLMSVAGLLAGRRIVPKGDDWRIRYPVAAESEASE